MKGYRDPLLAGALALVPGAGQIYAGQPLRGLTFIVGIAVGLFLFVIPGVLIWLASIADAVLCARRRNQTAPGLPLPDQVLPLRLVPPITDGPLATQGSLSQAPGNPPSAPPSGSSR